MSSFLSSYINVRSLFLSGVSLVYLSAFLSYYIQYPGLYGVNGLLPIATSIQEVNYPHHFMNLPSLHSSLGVSLDVWMDTLTLVGIVLSVFGSLGLACAPIFVALFMIYYTLFMTGRVFMSFQWDILLLEVGFATIFTSSLLPSRTGSSATPYSSIYLLRVILFKLMLMSGVVKLHSHCPTWNNLTALHYHFATQCLPTPLAYHAHYLPDVVKRASVAFTFISEGPAAYLILLPFRGARILGGFFQLVLMVGIALTGNYNFFNLLTALLALMCFDDSILKGWRSRSLWAEVGLSSLVVTLVAAWPMFGIKIPDIGNFTKISIFMKRSFLNNLDFILADYALPIALGLIAFTSTMYMVRSAYEVYARANQRVGWSLIWNCICLFTSTTMIMANVSVISTLSNSTRLSMPFAIKQAERTFSGLHVVSEYGLFRQMTGVGPGNGINVARPEVIINLHINGTWHEVDFLHKPGNVSIRPTVVAPHQPRLDWQMWFAALGSINHNPWLVHLGYKLLKYDGLSRDPVIDLLGKWPVRGARAQSLSMTRYTYDFAPQGSRDWWIRKNREGEEYIQTVRSSDLTKYIQAMQFPLAKVTEKKPKYLWAQYIWKLRKGKLLIQESIFAFLIIFGIWCTMRMLISLGQSKDAQ